MPLLNIQRNNAKSEKKIDSSPGKRKKQRLQKSVEMIQKIISNYSIEDINNGIIQLISIDNWRPHLPAILAAYLIRNDLNSKTIDKLWLRVSHGSWVSPQICTILSLVDSQFYDRAQNLINNGVWYTSDIHMNSLEKHSARGPASDELEKNKVILALEYLCNNKINDTIIDDNGGIIARKWKEGFTEIIKNSHIS
ncbi:MAG: hypothetical protein GY756_13535 [bacterium]|nr:hypothetical protein [bacterium]